MYKQNRNQTASERAVKRREVNITPAECVNVFSRAAIYLRAKVLLHSLPPPLKREVKQRDNITRFEGIAFHTRGPEAEICRYAKQTHTGGEEDNTLFMASRMSLKQIQTEGKKEKKWIDFGCDMLQLTLFVACRINAIQREKKKKIDWLWIAFPRSVHFIDLLPRVRDTKS